MPITANTANITISAATIVEPTGVPATIDISMPASVQMTDSTAEQIVTFRKLLNTLIADSAGKITRAEISNDPTRFIASTIIVAVMTAIITL